MRGSSSLPILTVNSSALSCLSRPPPWACHPAQDLMPYPFDYGPLDSFQSCAVISKQQRTEWYTLWGQLPVTRQRWVGSVISVLFCLHIWGGLLLGKMILEARQRISVFKDCFPWAHFIFLLPESKLAGRCLPPTWLSHILCSFFLSLSASSLLPNLVTWPPRLSCALLPQISYDLDNPDLGAQDVNQAVSSIGFSFSSRDRVSLYNSTWPGTYNTA